MLKSTLNLDVLEAREVPAVIGLAKGGPQPEPPTIVTTVSIVRFALPSTVVGKAGILLPSLNLNQPDIHPQNITATVVPPNWAPIYIGK